MPGDVLVVLLFFGKKQECNDRNKATQRRALLALPYAFY
jgi:hypothetical protein